jgi:Ser/Thr protein kinase RdoA (MazF antagonist)
MEKNGLSNNQVISLVKDLYGVHIDEIRQLEGYYDLNYYVKSGDKEFVFKKTRIDTFESLDFQNKIMIFLAEKGFNVPKPIKSLKNGYITKYEGGYVRLLTYLPGKLITTNDYDKSTLERIGILAANIDKSLQSFPYSVLKRPDFIWDLQNSLLLREYINLIEDNKQKTAIASVLDAYETEVSPLKEKLRKGVRHNDFNDHNIVIGKEGSLGIIDFGDASYTFCIGSFAITLADFMMGQRNPLSNAKILFRAYTRIFPFEGNELKILPILIMTRLASIIVMSIEECKNNPNKVYVKKKIDIAWNVLKPLLELGSEKIFHKLCD